MALKNGTIADRVFKNGAIYTVDPNRSWARAVAVKQAEIIYVGGDPGADAVIGPHTEVIDLEGKMMLPGFHDVHVHLYEGGMQLMMCDLWDCHHLDDAIARITSYVQGQGQDSGEWIQCSGLQKTCASEFSREILDKITMDRPIYIRTSDGHSFWANSTALERANISQYTSDPPQGKIEL
jgi:predicted amidohydrolase YtcJ